MKKNNFFVLGMLAMALTFGLVLAGCPADSPTGSSNFDGSTLAGTKWAATQSETFPLGEGLSMDMKVTLQFNSDIAGTVTIAITKWNGPWDAEMKTKVEGMMAEENGPFTSTYNAETKTGTYTQTNSEEEVSAGTFTVDVGKKELTTTITDEDGETETTIFKLQ